MPLAPAPADAASAGSSAYRASRSLRRATQPGFSVADALAHGMLPHPARRRAARRTAPRPAAAPAPRGAAAGPRATGRCPAGSPAAAAPARRPPAAGPPSAGAHRSAAGSQRRVSVTRKGGACPCGTCAPHRVGHLDGRRAGARTVHQLDQQRQELPVLAAEHPPRRRVGRRWRRRLGLDGGHGRARRWNEPGAALSVTCRAPQVLPSASTWAGFLLLQTVAVRDVTILPPASRRRAAPVQGHAAGASS